MSKSSSNSVRAIFITKTWAPDVGGATVNNEGIKTTEPSVSLSVQDRAVI